MRVLGISKGDFATHSIKTEPHHFNLRLNMIFTGKSHSILQTDTTPCTGHPLVTMLLPGARTSGYKNATVVLSPKQRRMPDPARSFLPKGGNRLLLLHLRPVWQFSPLACSASQGNLTQLGKTARMISFVIRCCVARAKRKLLLNAQVSGYSNNTQCYISFL